MGLDEESGAVADRGVGSGEHRPPDADDEAFFRPVIFEHVGVGGDEQTLRFARLPDAGQEGIPRPPGDSAAELLVFIDIVGEEILEIQTVGGVAVVKEVGQPAMVHLQPLAHLRGIGFHKVAVEIEACGGHPPAHLLRTVLIDAVVGREAFMAIDVEDGDNEEDKIIMKLAVLFIDQKLARQQHHRILAF